jgi:hypothetical protein
MSFGESMFLAGFNQKITKEDLFVKGNHAYLRWYLHGKTLEDSRGYSTEVGPEPLPCGASQPHLLASRPVGPSYQPSIAMSVLHCL